MNAGNKLIAILLVGLVIIAGCAQPGTQAPEQAGVQPTGQEGAITAPATEGKGKLVVAVTDEEPTTDVKAINLSGDIQACRGTQCITVAENINVNLLDTAGLSVVLGNVEIDVGAYSELKLTDVHVESETETGQRIEPKLATDEITVAKDFKVEEDGTTFIKLDLPADEWYTSKPDEVLTPKVETTIVEDAKISTETVKVDGETYTHANIQEGKITEVETHTVTETGAIQSTTAPAPAQDVEVHVKEGGFTTVTVVENGAISTFSQTQPNLEVIKRDVSTELGITEQQVENIAVLEHEALERAEKEAAETAHESAEDLHEAAVKSATADKALYTQKTDIALDTATQKIQESTGLNAEQKQALTNLFSQIETRLQAGQEAKDLFANVDTQLAGVSETTRNTLASYAANLENAHDRVLVADKAAPVALAVLESEKQELLNANEKLGELKEQYKDFFEFKSVKEDHEKAEEYVERITEHEAAAERLGGIVNIEPIGDITPICLSCSGTEIGILPEPIVIEDQKIIAEYTIEEALAKGKITEKQAEEAKRALGVAELKGTDGALALTTGWIFEKAAIEVHMEDFETAKQNGYTETETEFKEIKEKIEKEAAVIPSYDEAVKFHNFSGNQKQYEKAIVFQGAQHSLPVAELAPYLPQHYSGIAGAVPLPNGIPVLNFDEFKRLGGDISSEEKYKELVGRSVSGIKIDTSGSVSGTFIPEPQYYAPPAGYAYMANEKGEYTFAANYAEKGQQTSFTGEHGEQMQYKDGQWSVTRPDGTTETFKPYTPERGQGVYAYVPPISQTEVSYYHPYTGDKYDVDHAKGTYEIHDQKKGTSYDGSLGIGAPPALGSAAFVPPTGWSAGKGYAPPTIHYESNTGENWVLNTANASWKGVEGSHEGAIYTPSGGYIPPTGNRELPQGFQANESIASQYSSDGHTFTGTHTTQTNYEYKSGEGFVYTGTGSATIAGTYDAHGDYQAHSYSEGGFGGGSGYTAGATAPSGSTAPTGFDSGGGGGTGGYTDVHTGGDTGGYTAPTGHLFLIKIWRR